MPRRRIVGYAIGGSIDTRLALAALKVAIERRRPQPGCIHHSDRGSQGAVGYLAPSWFVRSSHHRRERFRCRRRGE
jgi:transposase InsO family protein